MKNFNMIKAFTLAETLVTLMIIGVIAAMTIPGLQKVSEERSIPPRVLKAYNTVSTATKELRQEYGPIKLWPWANTEEVFTNMYMKKFNIAQNCKNNGGCFGNEYAQKTLAGQAGNKYQTDKGWYTFATADGMLWAAKAFDGCNRTESNYVKNSCAYFEVDVNGQKEPNMVGVDTFAFTVNGDGQVYPLGGCPGCNEDDCKSGEGGNGWGCTAKLIREGKISW